MSNRSQRPIIFKIVLIGAKGVGRTSLLKKWESEAMIEENDEANIDHSECKIQHNTRSYNFSNQIVNLQLWDCCHHTENIKMNKVIFEKATVALLAYDLTRRETFEELPHFIEHCRKYQPSVIIIPVGMKLDLVDEREISKEEAIEFCTNFGTLFPFEITVHNDKFINEVFHEIAEKLNDIFIKKVYAKNDKDKKENSSFSEMWERSLDCSKPECSIY